MYILHILFHIAVALLAFNQQSSLTGIIKLNDVKFSVGFNDLKTLTNTGKILCKTNGLYMITVSIICSTVSAEFKIMLNRKIIAKNRIDRGGVWHTTTTAMVLQLHASDNIWVETAHILSVSSGSYSSFSIIKVKWNKHLMLLSHISNVFCLLVTIAAVILVNYS